MSGTIDKGDFNNLIGAYMKYSYIRFLYINSNGGDLDTALKIADFIKKNHIGVVVKRGGYCASACFQIYIAGFDRVASAANDDGTLPISTSAFGFVGIHRPYFASIAAADKQESMMARVKHNLISAKVPQYLIDTMMSRPSNDIYWLVERDFEMLGEFNPGDEEALIKKCGYKRNRLLASDGVSKEQLEKMTDCTFDYWEKTYLADQTSVRNGILLSLKRMAGNKK